VSAGHARFTGARARVATRRCVHLEEFRRALAPAVTLPASIVRELAIGSNGKAAQHQRILPRGSRLHAGRASVALRCSLVGIRVEALGCTYAFELVLDEADVYGSQARDLRRRRTRHDGR